MINNRTKYFLASLGLMLGLSGCQPSSPAQLPGLVGLYFSEPNLTAIKAKMVLTSLDQNWDESAYQETGSSGIWDGYIVAPVDGLVTFQVETNKIIEVKIGDDYFVTADLDSSTIVLGLEMVKGEALPMHITFFNDGKKDGHDYGNFSIKWSWEGTGSTIIPVENLYHTADQVALYKFLDDPDPATIDRSQFITIDAEHSVIYYEPGRFGGWPANNGIWNWGDEIVVGFNQAYYKHNPFHHSIDRSKPGASVLGRSMDGGLTWSIEVPENFSTGNSATVELTRSLSFTEPNVAIRCDRDNFVVSYDRGRSWMGPFGFAGLGMGRLSARTDYLVNGPNDAFFFVSADDVENVMSILQDRSFMAHTNDGGKSFEFVAWLAETDTVRSVMSSTVRVSNTHLVTTMRRRYDPPGDFRVLPKNWIDAYESKDNGRSWQFLAKIADTDRGKRNGNPPALVRLADGLLAVTYAYRGVPYSIRARVSADNGITWSKEIILRDDAATWDIGYCRSVVRADGKVVTVYYYSTEERPEQHIEATIWDPHLALNGN